MVLRERSMGHIDDTQVDYGKGREQKKVKRFHII